MGKSTVDTEFFELSVSFDWDEADGVDHWAFWLERTGLPKTGPRPASSTPRITPPMSGFTGDFREMLLVRGSFNSGNICWIAGSLAKNQETKPAGNLQKSNQQLPL